MSVDSALPSSTPSSATIRYRVPVGSLLSQVSILHPPPHPPLPRVIHQSENVQRAAQSERFAVRLLHSLETYSYPHCQCHCQWQWQAAESIF
jgi:hypothetical protein